MIKAPPYKTKPQHIFPGQSEYIPQNVLNQDHN